jgi:Secretion system C-terminal sorting domain/Fibronectin type III domain
MKTKLHSLLFSLFLVMASTSLFAQIITCPVPSATATTVISATSANLTWASNTATSYYKLQYRPVGISSATWTQFYAQTNSYTLTGLSCATGYEWQVQTICSNVAGSASTSAFSPSLVFTTLTCTSTCPVPTGLVAGSITTTGAQLSWTSASPAPAYFTIQYRPINTTAWISVSVQGASTFSLAQLNCNTTYEWQVKAICANSGTGSVSAFSASASFTTSSCTTACITPVGLTSNSITTASATVSWLAPVGAVYYKVQYRPLSPANANWLQATVTSGPTLTLSNLLCGTAYEWQVQSICSSAIGSSSSSPFSPSSNFTTLACTNICAAPSANTTTNILPTSATFNWVGVSGVSVYQLQYRLVTNVVTNWTQTTVQGSTFTLSNLICNAMYEWQVATVCSTANGVSIVSAFSPSVVFITAPCNPTCPVPSGLTSGNVTASTAYVGWQALAGVISYTIQYRAILPNVPPTNPWTQVTVQVNTSTLTGLLCNTNYEWQVRSNCSSATSGGISAFSPSSYFITSACSSVCVAPSGLNVTNVTPTSALLKWSVNAISLSGTYNVRYRKLNTLTWVLTTATANSKLVSGLAVSSYYEWQVQQLCPASNGTTTGTWSAWSNSAYFHTHLMVSASPNPANRILKLEVTTDENSDELTRFELRNLLGTLVYQSEEKLSSGSNQFEIPTANMAEGIYFLSVYNTSSKTVSKIYVKH